MLKMSELIYQLGSGGIFGYILGYAVKKVVKILAVIAALMYRSQEALLQVSL